MDVLKLHPCEALFGQHRRRRGRTRLVEALINWAPLGKALSRLFATLSSLFLLHLPSLLSFSFVYVLSPLVVVFVPNSFFFCRSIHQTASSVLYGLYRMIQKWHVNILRKLGIYLRIKLWEYFSNIIFSLCRDLENRFIQIRKTFILFTQLS